ncbi:MAG: UrcA family protein [Sphingomicrobium sp.]
MIIAHQRSRFYASSVLINEGRERFVMNYGKGLAMCGASLIAAIAIAIGAAGPFPLEAGTPRAIVVTIQPQNVERRINYADLNLAAVPGERSLNRRISYAVTSLCNEAVSNSTNTSFDYRDCESEAWRGVRPQVFLAVQRAHEIATTGSSTIGAAVITIVLPE